MKTRCPHCKSEFKADDSLSGKRTVCKKCGQKFVIEPAGAPVDAQVDKSEEVSETDPFSKDWLKAFVGGETVSASSPPPSSSPSSGRRSGRAPDSLEPLPMPEPPAVPPAGVQSGYFAQGRQGGDIGAFFVDCMKAIGYGIKCLGDMFILMLAMGLAWIGFLLVYSFLGGYLAQSRPGAILASIFAFVIMMGLSGYSARYFLDVINSSAQGETNGPPLPQWVFGEMFWTGMIMGPGILFVYITPVITFLLLPLGLLGVGWTGDGRGLNLSWAARAFFKRPGASLLLWLIMFLWYSIIATIAIILIFVIIGQMATSQDRVTSIMVACIGALVLSLVFMLFNCIIARCIGLFGYHFSDVLKIMPREPNGVVTLGYMGVGMAIWCMLTVRWVSWLNAHPELLAPRPRPQVVRPVMPSPFFREDPKPTYVRSEEPPPDRFMPPPMRPEPAYRPPPVITPPPPVREEEKEVMVHGDWKVVTREGKTTLRSKEAFFQVEGTLSTEQLEEAFDAIDAMSWVCDEVSSYAVAHQNRLPASMKELADAAGIDAEWFAPDQDTGLEYVMVPQAMTGDNQLILYNPRKYLGGRMMLCLPIREKNLELWDARRVEREADDQQARAKAARTQYEETIADLKAMHQRLLAYAKIHKGNFPASLKSLETGKSERDFERTRSRFGRSDLIYVQGNTMKSPATNILLYAGSSGSREIPPLALTVGGKVLVYKKLEDVKKAVTTQPVEPIQYE